ncbi:hypothetical protein [Pseudoalteromonas rubra]|uniref:Uncharacterized protein n=1 Tax=Pseudoalteromonas rubra TaxID=43658 RepID=A0A0F4QJX9_9GAMM|nr:hypothetical protein [Pseudoalteromonas rubra]KJZ07931.1 hypothetical protein TW77_13775 [Pseudoalteromonas rubra]
MENSIIYSYQQLPEQVKKVVRLHGNGSISFNTNKAVLVRLLAILFLLVSLFAFCLTLFIGEVFHIVSLFLATPLTIILFSHSNCIVVDHKSGTFRRQARLLWRSAQLTQQAKIEDIEVVMTKDGQKDGRRVNLMGQVLHFDKPSEAHAFLALLKFQFNANTLEQITAWPNKIPWIPVEDNEMTPGQSFAPLSDHIVPVWSLQDKLKLLIPALVFSAMAGLVQLGGKL